MGKRFLSGASARALIASVLASACAFTAPAMAQAPRASSPAAEMSFDIEAQPLSSALTEFARQSGVRVLYPYEDLSRVEAPSVRGRFTADEALTRLLANSGYTAAIQDGALRLEPARPQHAGETDNEETVVVTGTRIRGAAPAGANVIEVDRADIDATGRSSVQDVLQTLPQNFPGSQNELTQLGGSDARRNLGFASTVDLRGLGADATLTLLNGRRLAPAGFGNFVDISAIPLSAVERIEVLADGASATYGADAVAGVVNVILRNDFDGVETGIHGGAATRGGMEEFGASVLLGRNWADGEAMIAFDYRTRGGLAAAEREITSDSDLRRYGGTNFSRTQANPGNIIRVGANAVTFAIPEGQDGTSLSQSELLAGVRNFQNTNEGTWLYPDQESRTVFASIRQSMSPQVEVFFDALASDRHAYSERFQLTTTLVVPQTNAYRQLNNLFPGQGNLQISYYLGDDLGPVQVYSDTDTLSGLLGAAYDFDGGWRLEGALTYGAVNELSTTGNLFDSTAGLNAALASSNLATAFNPFADGSNTNAAVLSNLTYDSVTDSFSEILVYGFKADGPLFELPGGYARAAFGIEQRDERFRIDRHEVRASGTVRPFLIFPGHRVTDALFAEFYLPLLGEDNGVPLVHGLDLSLSLRREAPDDFTESTTPKLGFNWALSEDFRVRGSWGQSFKAPQFQQLLGSTAATITSIPLSLDPSATNGSTGAILLAGANPDLEPEEAESWTAGFDWRPSFAPGFSLSATYFNIDFANRIDGPGDILTALRNSTGFETVFFRNPTPQQIATYLGYAQNVLGTVPPDGIELIWDSRLTNLASLELSGVDIQLAYAQETDIGTISVFANASGLFEFTRHNDTAAAPLDVLNTMGNPVDWRGRFGLGWQNADWGASLAANYTNGYRDTLSAPNREIDAWTTWDLQLTHRRPIGDGNGRIEFALNVQNLADDDPPFVNNPFGYAFDSANASPVGRFIGVSLRRTW
jgi:iron complex outermembrane receptor protein